MKRGTGMSGRAMGMWGLWGSLKVDTTDGEDAMTGQARGAAMLRCRGLSG